jgi:hypothetical protein
VRTDPSHRPVSIRRAAIGGLLAGLLLLAPAARAEDYGVFIDVETEEDLLDLKTSGEITDATYETLRELLRDGVDLNRAVRSTLYALPNLTYDEVDAILEFRRQAGFIQDPAELVKAGALSAKKLGAIAPFIVVSKRKTRLKDVKGALRYGISYLGGDDSVPPMYLSARLKALQHLEVGFSLVLTHTWLGSPVFDPNRQALAASPVHVGAEVPKFFASWNTEKFQILGGTFRAGFGQRLIFDNTGQVSPSGLRIDDTLYLSQDSVRSCRESAGELSESPCGGLKRYRYMAPDMRWSNRLRGLGFSLKRIPVNKKHWLSIHGFLSHQTHGIYQYEIYDRGRCSDPRNDSLPECSAPYVYRLGDDRLAATSRYSFTTLPRMYNELLGGGNLTYHFSRRSWVGVTGYGSYIQWLVEGIDLDFQEYNARPFGGPFGAVGVNAAFGHKLLDLFLEVGHTFDSMPGKGGPAAVLRGVLTWKKQELELVARYYDQDFANPHARPISADDEFEGNQARDELGLRAKYTGYVKDLQLRALLDYWTNPSTWTQRLKLRVRADYELAQWFRPGAWIEYQDRDLTDTAPTNCYAVVNEYDFEGEPIQCRGEKIDLGLQLRFMPHKKLTISGAYQHRLVNDGARIDSGYRNDVSAWLLIMYKPISALRLRARVRYKFEDILHNDYLEHSIWSYLEAGYWYKRRFWLKARFEVLAYLDSRDSSTLRSPHPEIWARLEAEYRF